MTSRARRQTSASSRALKVRTATSAPTSSQAGRATTSSRLPPSSTRHFRRPPCSRCRRRSTSPPASYDIGILEGQENFGSDPGGEITLSGAGAASTILDGDNIGNDVLEIGGSGTTTIEGVTVENAADTGIYDNGVVELHDSVVQNNADVGIQDGDHGLTVSGSTISGNGNASAGVDTQFNGGIFSESGNLTVVNSTVTGNNGSGIYEDSSGGLSLQNDTIAANPSVGLDLVREMERGQHDHRPEHQRGLHQCAGQLGGRRTTTSTATTAVISEFADLTGADPSSARCRTTAGRRRPWPSRQEPGGRRR